MPRARMAAAFVSALLLASGVAAQPSAEVGAPSPEASVRHKAAAWAALSASEREAVQRFIDAAADRGQAEADFEHLGWRLFQFQELHDSAAALPPSRHKDREERLCKNVDAELAAMAPPTRAALWAALGASLQAAGYVDGRAPTAAARRPAVSGPPASYEEAVLKAQAALRQRDWEGALEAARFAEERAPQGQLWANVLQAAALSMLGRHDEALSEIHTAVLLKPKASGLRSAEAFVLNRAGRFQEAQRAVDLAIEDRPDRAWAWYQLAYAQAGLGDRAGSLESLDQAARFDAPRFGPRRSQALAASDAAQLLALFSSDPALEAAAFASLTPAQAARRRWASRLGWPAAALGLLGVILWLLFALRKPVTASLVRMGMAAAGTPLPVPVATPIMGLPPSTSPGQALPGLPAGYRILRQIGTGGMGAVYEAEDLSLQRRVAVKRMRDEIRNDPRERERFLAEARIVAQLKHPNIVDIHAIFEHEGEVFLVFEYLDGKTLDLVVYENGRLSIPEARSVLAQVCSALTYAHARGVIHRDLKPPNIMMTRDNRVKVMDFGVARQAHDALSRLSVSATVAGTPPYMAPESETGAVRAESDLYSLAVCLYEMLTGARPFDGTSAGMLMTKMNMVFSAPTRKAPGLPEGVDAFFARALQADPEQRPRTAAALLAEFSAAVGEARPAS